jgi:hypothetical protein
MKKLILLVAIITSIVGCSIDNNTPDSITYEVLAVQSYELPDSLTLGETYEIKLKYQKPTACHLFQGIYYDKKLNTRTIAIQTTVKDNEVCTAEFPALSEVTFNFYVTNTGSYIFKFYKGKDADDNNLFEDVEVQVVE